MERKDVLVVAAILLVILVSGGIIGGFLYYSLSKKETKGGVQSPIMGGKQLSDEKQDVIPEKTPTKDGTPPPLPQERGMETPPTRTLALPAVSYEVNTLEQVFPRSRITASPVFTEERRGLFAQRFDESTQDTIGLVNLRFALFMEPNLYYRVRAQWETNKEVDNGIVAIWTSVYNRLADETTIEQVDTLSSYRPGPSTSFTLEGAHLEENKEYIFTIQSCFAPGGCVAYNLTITTPPIPTANVHCNRLIEHGSHDRKFDLIFVSTNYTRAALSNGTLERDVTTVLSHGDPTLPSVMSRRAFFDIPVLNESFDAFNVVVVHDEVPCCYDNQLFAIGKACGFDKGKDAFVIMQNVDTGTAYAQGLGRGIWIMLPKGHDYEGGGVTLAHELGHLFGLDEEYYFTAGGAMARNAPNCDYGNLTCQKWCSGVRHGAPEAIHAAKLQYDACLDIFNSGNQAAWQSFCPTLDLDEAFERAARMGETFYGSPSQGALCASPMSNLQAYICYAGTFVPLEDEDIGVGCQEGYGCYLGCGTQYYFTRGSYVSIMGGGALGENTRMYRELDRTSTTPMLPDYSKPAEDVMRRYLQRFI